MSPACQVTEKSPGDQRLNKKDPESGSSKGVLLKMCLQGMDNVIQKVSQKLDSRWQGILIFIRSYWARPKNNPISVKYNNEKFKKFKSKTLVQCTIKIKKLNFFKIWCIVQLQPELFYQLFPWANLICDFHCMVNVIRLTLYFS